MKGTCDVLILTSAFGFGHNSVARAIKEQLIESNPALNVVTEDIMDIASPKTKNVYFGIYKTLTRNHTKLYNFFYRIKKDIPNNGLDQALYNLYLRRVGKYIMENKPQLIVSTFPLCSGFVSKVKEKYDLDVPLITSITDVVDSWEWIHNNTDMYFVPCRVVEEKLIEKGIDREKIRRTGIPVKRDFLQSERKDKEYKQVLIMGGAMDKVGLNSDVLSQFDAMSDVKVIVVTGNNKDLYERLNKEDGYMNIEVLGYSNEIAKLMDESDLVVTKPGGVTLFEAINKGIPVALRESGVGQERENVSFIRSSGIGILLDGQVSLHEQVAMALEDPDALNTLRQSMEDLRMEIEPEKIGHYALELI